ncbi:MAG: hypothetical protein GWN99_00675 [Gemmatimonadetes bacterium]|uniref:Sulfocyanin-like C-terminal domain-containing protein n=1 Tax=Candidatus Kutchimonas denitrificans TaxID=3056748 RepID=A0AAE5C9N8_9BACT|nr:hypothetical protein [Gemmatimonadota bacterium]NIR73622.1 hypothetical protein [Candidatus Kutchimonas denitrificans]NIR99581.1 hypothetical protein [Gemmatimonadota bacterium]NIT65201.1 hypothetical protein [Gemmatimonadota bacterium]NIV23734.1 hypothetical protein [Gemmatimonadota bacterium]
MLGLTLVASALTGAAVDGMAQEEGRRRISPDWMSVDAANQRVDLDIVAGLTTVNNAWNFNGYADGDMTIAVPLGWQVQIHFSNQDANYPHSVGIVEIEDPMPVSGDETTMAFPRAFSLKFVGGLFDEDTFAFKVNRTGKFWLFCGVPVHGRNGMWDYFVVSDEISEPYVEVPEGS